MSLRALTLSLTVAAALILSACGTPPDKEIHQAQGAIDAARAVGADQYAHDEFAAAEAALARANDAVAQRDYRLALNHALDARDRAQTAAKQAADSKAKARVTADRALAAAARELETARQRLKAAEAARVPSKTLAEMRREITAAERTVQKARTSFDAGDFPAAAEAADTASSRLQSVARTLDSPPTAVPRRRR